MFGHELLVQLKAKEFSLIAVKKSAPPLGYEVFDTQTPQVIGEMVAKRAIEQLKAKSPKGGKVPSGFRPKRCRSVCA